MTNKRNDGNTSAKDEARTPPEIFGKLNAEFHFDIDLCANEINHLCELYFTRNIDALKQPWAFIHWPGGYPSLDPQVPADPVMVSFCQPPYSNGNILKFVHKAYLESGKGATVVMLIPSDPSTQYFNICFENASEIRFMRPRVRFNNPDGTPMKGSPQTGSMIVVFRPGEHKETKLSIWKWKE